MTRKKIKIWKIGAVFTILGLIISSIFSLRVFADSDTEPPVTSSGSQVSVSLSDIITLRILDAEESTEIENLTLDLTPTPLGVFTKGNMLAEVSTSNSSGYKLYLSSDYQDSESNYTTSLVNLDSTVGTTEKGKIPTLTGTISETAFSERESDYRNRWGYSTNALTVSRTINNNIVTNTITDNTNPATITYNPIPAYDSSLAIRSDTLSPVEQELTPVTIGVNASSAVAAGTYRNVLAFSAVANPPMLDYNLMFNSNTTNAVSNMPENQSEDSMAGSVTFTIPDTIPTRTNYTFVSWNTEPNGSGTSYAPGDNYTITADDSDKASRSRTLYAVWKQYVYKISYNCRKGSCPSDQTIRTGDDPYVYTIPSTVPTKTGYNFVDYTGSDDNDYSPGETILFSTSNTTVQLTANWTVATTITVGGRIWTASPASTYSSWTYGSSLCTSLGSGWRLPTTTEFLTLIGASKMGEKGTNTTNINLVWSSWGEGVYFSSMTADWSDSYAHGLDIDSNDTATVYSGYAKVNDYRIVCTK